MNIKPYGDRALLLDCDSLDEAQGWFAALDGRIEVVLGARSVLVVGDPKATRALLRDTRPGVTRAVTATVVEIPVTYDGDDLLDVSRLVDLAPDDVVSAHTGSTWTVAFGGFAPGFFYLVGGDARLHVPRRDSPRTRVPTGSVGLAGEFSGIYPRESPGGWQLIGHTALTMWDTSRERAALLAPGTTVRFVVA